MDPGAVELTMLFTDIEGSTRLLTRLGPAYADVLADHRRILRAAFAEWGGDEMGTEGDSFFVVFGSAADGVAAAAQGQQGLESHAWPEAMTLRVRMGLHSGRAERFDDNLVGLDVHLAARVSSTAYGGQVVLSEATARQVEGRLPPGASLVDLGRHRLKDIGDPQHLFQLHVPGLPDSFPPLRSLGAPGSLPVAPTLLVGRDAELSALTGMLSAEGARLVTLTGPGGAGKTRLALAVAGVMAPGYRDGVHFVDLASTTDRAVAWTTIAETLGRTGESGRGLLEHLREHRLLLLLDNLEQLPDAAAVVTELLAATDHLQVLATSRGPLHAGGEQVFPVGPLGLPEAGQRAVTLAEASTSESVRFFTQQARLADPDFTLTEENVADVVALCRRLDGLPLAVELAAARVRLLPPRALLDHLGEALQLPLEGHPERHRTLMATVDWSYRMVDAADQRAFRGLAVFGGAGGTFPALASVLGERSVLGMVSGLLDAGLVRVDDDPAGARVRLLQTIRVVARDLAAQAGELDGLQARHAEYYLALAERTSDRLRGRDAVAARIAIELEMENLRAALDWSLGEAAEEAPPDEDRAATGIRLCTALGWFWYRTGYDAESRRWLERASKAAAEQQGSQLAKLLHTFALLLLQQGDAVTARDVLAKALLLWRRAGDRDGEAGSLNSLGVAYRTLGAPDRAGQLLRDSIDLARALPNAQREATALTNLALLEIDLGHPDQALPLLDRAERLDRELGNEWGVATDRVNQAGALLVAGRPQEAAALLRDLAGTVSEHGDPDLTFGVLELAAVAASKLGDHPRAVRLAACADQQRDLNAMPLAEPDRAFLEAQLPTSRLALGDRAQDVEGSGRLLSVPAALAEVRQVEAGR